MSQYLTVAKRAARDAASVVMKQYGKVPRSGIQYKKHNEMVTALDRASERVLIRTIRKHFPKHAILSEEYGAIGGSSDHQWAVDPIDGTFNFIIQVPYFSIVLGMIVDGEVKLGVVYAPAMKKMYWAEAGKGAYLNGKRIRVSKNSDYLHSLNTYTHSKSSAVIHRAARLYTGLRSRNISLRHLGSIALEMCYVAEGIIDSQTSFVLQPWDYAAGVLMVREAGGNVTDFKGRQWTKSSKNALASNGLFHKKVLADIDKYAAS